MGTVLRMLVTMAGLALLAAGGLGALQTRRFVSTAASGSGTVIRLNAGGSHPQIAFHTQDGAAISYPQGGMIAGFQIGQTVRVLYEPQNPIGTARLQSFGSLWGGCLMTAIGGAALLALGLASFVLPIGFYLKGR